MKRAFSGIAAALSLIGGSVAVAADLPTAPVKAPAVATAVYNWTGLYVGANGGWGWDNQDPRILFANRFDRTSMSISGGWSVEPWVRRFGRAIVLGVEGDLDWV
jgi:outer membrane immunogenic protein